VGVVRGSDPVLRYQYVAIGAHNDHVPNQTVVDHDSLRAFNTIVRPGGADSPMRPATAEEMVKVKAILDSLRKIRPARLDSISNGADDDGSGSVTVLEVAEAIAAMKTKPKRSILFLWYTSEELGLLGSQWYTEHATVPRDSVVAAINMDMVGRGMATDMVVTDKGKERFGGPTYLQLVGSRRLSTEYGDLIETLNKAQDTVRVRLHLRRERPPAEHLLPLGPLQLGPLGRPRGVLHHRAAPRLPPGDRRAAVHRLPAHGRGREVLARPAGGRGQQPQGAGGRQAEAGSVWGVPAVSGKKARR